MTWRLPLLLLLAALPFSLPAQLRESAGPWQNEDFKQFVTFEVRETAGLDRKAEPVEVQVRLPSRDIRVVRWSSAPEEVVSQVVEAQPDGVAYKLRIVFPATVARKSTELYRVYFNNPDTAGAVPEPAAAAAAASAAGAPAPSAPAAPHYPERLKITAVTQAGFVVENDDYIADAAQRTVRDKAEDSGQINSLTIKFAGVRLAREAGGSHNRIHWAPNFQRTGEKSYTGVARWDPVQSVEKSEGPVVYETRRSGYVEGYPEIALNASYRFYAGLPYFIFESEMRIMQPIQLFLLRDDEMTMDGVFTRLAWPGRTPGSVASASFDEAEAILARSPIPANAPWVCFYNPEKGFGYGSVRVKFDTRNDAGKPSVLAHPYTKISDGVGGGKYWNRRLIDERDTMVPAGSRYFQQNAYVVFHVAQASSAAAQLAEFLEWEKRLRKPLAVQMQGTKAWTARQADRKPAPRQTQRKQ